MRLHIIRTKKFVKSFDKLITSGKLELDLFHSVVNKIADGEILNLRYQDHKLIGILEGYRECHLKPDILLIYEIRKEELILILLNIGSHSELFG